MLGARRRVLGEEHPDTLMSASNMAASLSRKGEARGGEADQPGGAWCKHCEEAGTRRGASGHAGDAGNLASSLSDRAKHAEAERIERKVLGARRRVLGEEHPDTLASAMNLASSLSGHGKYAEAEEILQAAHQPQQRVLGSAHPVTLATAELLGVRAV
jgi:hypothetical protein